MPLTDDIKPDWLNVIRRLQSVASQQKGYAIISVQVVVDATGAPVFWCEPELMKLEPQGRGAQFLAQMIRGMRQ
jgi:hypothetical protein